MESVCHGKEWDVALVFDKPLTKKFLIEDCEGATLVGAMPYLIGKRLGMRYIMQPELTQYSGPWYNYDYLKQKVVQNYVLKPELHPSTTFTQSERLEYEKKVADKLLLQIDRLGLAYFQQNFSTLITNWLPFHWWGYSQTTRYTYRIPNLDNLDDVFFGFDNHHRRAKINEASKVLVCDTLMTPEEFADYHSLYWSSKGKQDILSKEFITRVCHQAIDHNQGAIITARRADTNEIMGARFIAWDNHTAYALLSFLSLTKHPNGTSPLLFWESIKHVSQISKANGHSMAFDFEGSMDMNIEQSYRLYGAEQTPYHQITKCNKRLFMILLEIKLRQSRRKLKKAMQEIHESKRKKRKRK